MFPEWHHAVPESAYFKVPETLKTFRMYSTSRYAPCSTRLPVVQHYLEHSAFFLHMERGSSAVECRTRNQVSPGSNPHLLPFRRLGIFVLSIDASVGGNMSDLVVARNCSMARMLPGEAELVLE